MRRLPRSLARACAVVLVVPAALAGCTSGPGTQTEPKPDTLKPRLEGARTILDDAETLDISLETPELPSGTTGLLEAKGQGTHAPAFKGKVRVSTGGTSLNADVISVGGEVYAKTGFSPTFVPFDPSTVGAPDPADLVASEDGVSSLLTSTEDLEVGDKTRDGADVLTAVDGTLPGELVRSLIPTADESADFDVSYRLTDKDVLRDATIKGPFYPGSDDVTYTIKISASDKSVDITAP